MNDSRIPEPNEQPPQEQEGIVLEDVPFAIPVGPSERPSVTHTIIAVCGLIFLFLNLGGKLPHYEGIGRILIPTEPAIWRGAWWGLLITAFVHVAILHILFNMWWTKYFGAVLEPTMGRVNYVLFIAASAVVSSGAQLAFSSQMGIGFSGVLYAMFGYAMAARHVEPRYRAIVDARVIKWLLGWMVLCVILTRANVLNVGNAAHVAGFLFGYFMGNLFVARVYVAQSATGLALLAVMTVLSVTYMPWSRHWQNRHLGVVYVRIAEGAERGEPGAQLHYAVLLMKRAGRKADGLSWMRKAAEQGHLPAMNALAWTLATDKEEPFRDGAKALEWAQRVCKEDNWKTAAYIDTLAAAYAEVENWDEAAATQRQAIEKWTSGDGESKAGYEARLQKFIKHEKARE